MSPVTYIHSFFAHKLDAGPIRLVTIAHAFNYRVAVLRYGVKSATRVRSSRKAEGRILNDTDISWGHQVAVMFQIISALALEVPTFLQNIERLWGVSPDVHLYCEPWGHVDHRDGLLCNELGGNMARNTQFPIMITRSTIIYDITSPGAAGSSIYV